MRKSEEEAKERFDKDISNHEMKIRVDDGVNRHITFKRPGSNCYRFDLVTWPGYMCYTGDMGTFVFSRVNDMFEFFRAGGSRINPGYWAEKLQATNVQGGHYEYSPDLLKQAVDHDLENFIEYRNLSAEDEQRLRDEVKDDLTYYFENDLTRDLDLVVNFEFDDEHVFTDFWDHNFKEHTFHYIWCCHAIVWGINQYDEHKVKVSA